MDIFSLFKLVGGLAFFLYGMNVMSAGLEKMTGGKLEKALKKVTSNPIKSLAFGAGVTIAIQSSSAMTVMLVGFVNSGIMELEQTICMIMGSNIGTTLTAWVLSLAGVESENVLVKMLNPENFSPIVAMIGILLIMVAKKRKKQDIGTILVGFSILMFGMTEMGDAVRPLAYMPQFSKLLVAFTNPIVGVLVGTIFTGIIQSSAASVGILQALSMTGHITYQMAIPVIMGQNIGTCVTALISSIGVNKNAKRVAIIHIYFNIIGTIVCLIAFYSLNAIFQFSFTSKAIHPIEIAGVHSIFNIVTTLLLLPFTKQLEYLAKKTIRSQEKAEVTFLDQRLLATPSVAIAECKENMLKMMDLVQISVTTSTCLTKEYKEVWMKQVWENEDMIDSYEDNLGTYLLKLEGTEVSEEDSKEVSKILHMLGDLERIGDHALNIAKLSAELHTKELTFSKEAQGELHNLVKALSEIISVTFLSYQRNSSGLAKKVEPLEQVIDIICSELREKHIKRLQQGECTVEVGFIFNELVANVKRISDHCSNIAVCILRVKESTFDTHEYLQKMKSEVTGQYADDFQMYYRKYNERGKEGCYESQ